VDELSRNIVVMEEVTVLFLPIKSLFFTFSDDNTKVEFYNHCRVVQYQHLLVISFSDCYFLVPHNQNQIMC
jgi:hypothetical protein